MQTTSGLQGIIYLCNCQTNVIPLPPYAYRDIILSTHRTIFVADEGSVWYNTVECAHYVKHSDNYFVFITCKPLYCQSYGMDAVLEAIPVDNGIEFVPKFTPVKLVARLCDVLDACSTIITEDKKSGFQFYESAYPGKCITSDGKDSMLEVLKHVEPPFVACVDGLGFGPIIAECMDATVRKKGIFLCPQSFEYLLLKYLEVNGSPYVTDTDVSSVDATDTGYKAYFESALRYALSKIHGIKYSKKKLPKLFLDTAVFKEIVDILHDMNCTYRS